MNTSVVQQVALTNKLQWALKLSLLIFAGSLIPFIFAPTVQSEDLLEGTWTGSYTLDDGTQLETRYVIGVTQDSEAKSYTIKMFILDIERESPYILKNISLQEKTLSFTKENETAEITTCQLMKNEQEEYHGTCQSSLDQEGSRLAQVLMIPPKEE